jgi:hypothetical protein
LGTRLPTALERGSHVEKVQVVEDERSLTSHLVGLTVRQGSAMTGGFDRLQGLRVLLG